MVGLNGDLTVGDITQDIDVSFKDILSDLEIGGSVYTQIGKGKHAVHIDYTYLRTRPDPSPLPSPPFMDGAELETKLTVNIVEAAYQYRWNGPDSHAIVGGARLVDMKMRMNIGGLPAVETGPDWWDYFVGIKTHNAISPKWDFEFYGTIGAGGSDLPWTLRAGFLRKYSNGNRLALGFSLWGIDYTDKDGLMDRHTVLDTNFYGFMLGYEFN